MEHFEMHSLLGTIKIKNFEYLKKPLKIISLNFLHQYQLPYCTFTAKLKRKSLLIIGIYASFGENHKECQTVRSTSATGD